MMPLDQMLLNPCGLLEYIYHYAVTVVKLEMSLDIKICRTIYPFFLAHSHMIWNYAKPIINIY